MSIDEAALALSLRRLSLSREDNGSVISALQAVLTACVDLFGVAGAGVLIADEQDLLRYVAASDRPGRILETTEADAGEGPCTEAFVTAQVVASSDVAAETERWPTLTRALADQPVRAVLGVPVRLGGVPVGTLDVYMDRPHDWDPSEVAALTHYAEVIATTLSAAVQAHTAGEMARQLQFALDHRVLIERAVGYLMASRSIDAVAAFNALRTAARSRRTKINVVAEHVLTTGALPA
ncbi:ANTAR domain-containing protein [Nocardioides alpinus]|uniref:ANTAR domain-containing protein n=1 Tax=Nocardioides alpinus TaxID=748909 RepID=A0A1I0ZEZ7_9ACTN|nr:GAF and ANTAR domain-containing protein [Nocardioides alpinus]PKH40625.1 transcriptional regulator [Nocardioides alpinus]SFB24234.1 ANTAR domain-containing protein [Nocardioides alpinus]